ncbi:MAG: hypothetical protein B7Z35_15285 [Hydrogenophilales bacterium 12-61-10]|nr:MAG: hypothetical protein B7Z35_15285 [Hydrogenophilales bacterium 12-61-10]OYX27900.1 MAG: hypothetical protein B7Z03_12870 [Hydrogenophilales bacterium 32-62-9]
MHTTHPASLLVAALVMLRHPCSRNQATARLLLERAAEHAELTPVEREACRSLADDMHVERPEPDALRAHWLTPRPVHPQGAGRGCTDAKASTTTLIDQGTEHRRLNLVEGLPSPNLKGVSA